MKNFGSLVGLLLFSAATAVQAGTPIPLVASSPNFNEPSQIVSTLNSVINNLNSNGPAYFFPFAGNRNFLDNGAMNINQRGSATTATCATTSAAASANYSADRWVCDVNVTSGAGQGKVVSSTPTPPIGFAASETLVRNSGALTQPQCMWQEVPTSMSTMLQGQTLTLSYSAQALAGLSAD